MLLEFKIKNYKSFVDETTFSMIPAPKQTGLDYSILNEKAGNATHKALCSAVVYGPNASGKTNIIGAMETLRTIILRGNIRNSDINFSPNIASSSLELIPNCFVKNRHTNFSISFIEKGFLITYELTLDLGDFLEKDYKRKVLEEKLFVNKKEIFSRGEKFDISIPASIKHLSNKYT